MDLVLEFLDDYILDDVYAKLFPLTQSTTSIPNYSPIPLPDVVKSAWQSLVSSQLMSSSPPTPVNTTFLSSSSLGSPASAWPRDFIGRQVLSLIVATIIGIHILYFLVAGLSYRFIFNHDMMRHPRFLPNQVRKEIQASVRSFPGMLVLMLPLFLCEVRGYTRLYDKIEDYGWAYFILSFPLFLIFTDYCIYWIHRWLHLPWFYKRIHKPHHKWIVPTPFASHAFHPVDGFAQGLPYHLFIFMFPMQRHLYLLSFILVNCWSIFIHDSDMITGHPLEKFINGPAHHTLHHLYFVCNYGQYFTFADRAGGSYRHPDSSLDPLLEVKARDELSVEQRAKENSEKERRGDDLAEEWEQKILGSNQIRIKTE